MNYSKQLELLFDEFSKTIFRARLNYIRDKRLSVFYDKIKSVGSNYKLRDVETFSTLNGINKWIIWGSDDVALYNYKILIDCNYDVMGFSANSLGAFKHLEEQYIDTQKTIELLKKENCGIIVNSKDLLTVPACLQHQKNVLVVHDHVVGRCGWQYFDFFSAKEEEVFVDAGALDGATSQEFIKWCSNKYKMIYAFEPNPTVAKTCECNLLKQTSKVKFYNFALWERCDTLTFKNDSSIWDACICKKGNVEVPCETLDNLLINERITFFKLDVEGSELQALKGAKSIILKNKPRMAISVYHNEMDLFVIIDYLHGLVPNYRFAIRHYHSDTIETILYAFIE